MIETKEPWAIARSVVIISANNDSGNNFDIARFRYRNDASRAAECVNAMRGIASPESYINDRLRSEELLETFRGLCEKRLNRISELEQGINEIKQHLLDAGYKEDHLIIVSINELLKKQ